MSIEKVRSYFQSLKIADRIMEFPVSSATVELAAEAMNCDPCRIAKTLSFYGADGPILVVTAGDARVHSTKFKNCFGIKSKMLSYDDVENLIGHAVGGVCPFVVNPGVQVWLDKSLQRFATVFPACGSSNSAIELTPAELEFYSAASGWVDVCKDWQ